MSMDRSLRTGSGLVRHRNVLTRAERLARMSGDGKWKEGDAVLHMPKVGNRKLTIGKKAPKKAEEGADAAKPGAAKPAAGGAKPAAAGAKAPAKK